MSLSDHRIHEYSIERTTVELQLQSRGQSWQELSDLMGRKIAYVRMALRDGGAKANCVLLQIEKAWNYSVPLVSDPVRLQLRKGFLAKYGQDPELATRQWLLALARKLRLNVHGDPSQRKLIEMLCGHAAALPENRKRLLKAVGLDPAQVPAEARILCRDPAAPARRLGAEAPAPAAAATLLTKISGDQFPVSSYVRPSEVLGNVVFELTPGKPATLILTHAGLEITGSGRTVLLPRQALVQLLELPPHSSA